MEPRVTRRDALRGGALSMIGLPGGVLLAACGGAAAGTVRSPATTGSQAGAVASSVVSASGTASSGVAPDWVRAHLPATSAERSGRRFDAGRLPRQAAEQEALAVQIGADGAALLAALGLPDAPTGAAMLPAVVTRRRVWLQRRSAPDDDGRRRWRAAADLPPAGAAITSPYDVAARYSHKGDTAWVGYKGHCKGHRSETCDPERPRLITHVAATPGAAADNDVTDQIHRGLAAKHLAPAERLVGAGSTDAALLVSSRARGIDPVGPARQDTGRPAREEGGYGLTRFAIDWAAERATRPNGRQSAAWSRKANDPGEPASRVAFARQDCRACPARARGTAAKGGPRRPTLRPQPEHAARHAARRRQATAAFRVASARRAGVEGAIAQAAGAGGARDARYRSRAKPHLPAGATAVAINLHRLWGRRPDPTPFHPHPPPLATLGQTTAPATCGVRQRRH